jgi:hypothetical protein
MGDSAKELNSKIPGSLASGSADGKRDHGDSYSKRTGAANVAGGEPHSPFSQKYKLTVSDIAAQGMPISGSEQAGLQLPSHVDGGEEYLGSLNQGEAQGPPGGGNAGIKKPLR